MVSSCETQETILTTTDSVNGVSNENSTLKQTTKQIKWMNRKQSEAITLEIATILGKPISTSKTTSNSIELDLGSVELDKVLGITDESEITNYTYNVIPKNGSSNKFYNLVYTKIGKNKKVKILEYAMTDAFKDAYYKGQKSINQFKGTITEISIGSLTGKSQDLVPCPQIEIILPGTTELSQQAIDRTVIDYPTNGSSSGGSTGSYSAGSSSVSGLGSLTQTCGWVAVSVKCASGDHSVGEKCYLDISQQPSLYFWNNCTGATISSYKTSNTKATKEEIPCNPGATGVIAPSKAQILKDEFLLTGDQWRFIRGNDAIASSLFNYYYGTVYKAEAKVYDLELLTIMMQNPGLVLDATASEKSPFNVDLSAIPFDLSKPENQKFNTLYNALSQSPEFKKLFLDIFQDSNKVNVKFEIAEHVYKDNDPTKEEVHAITIQDPITKNIVIKISKQILVTDGTMSQTKIENAKTILHECIHAYLLTITSFPLVGFDIAEVINMVLPTDNEQHDFMYNKMIPTMQMVLGEIRDLVTTQDRRAEVESLTMHPTRIPLTSEPWDWNKYYHFLSLSGLHNTSYFILNYPKDSNSNIFYNEYNAQGRRFLKN